jgi:micrococcal nuclease
MFFFLFCSAVHPDTIEMSNGTKIDGLVVEETDDFIKIELVSGGYMKLKRSEVKTITKLFLEQGEQLEQKLDKTEKQSAQEAQQDKTRLGGRDGPFDIIRVIDGDTIVLSMDGKNTTVRLIGVDTPETVHPQKQVEAYGHEASEFTKNLLKGEQVALEYESGSSRLDKYGRLLAYVYRHPDGLFVNLEIVRQGYGHAYTKYPFQYMETFCSYEKNSREVGKGLWAPEVSRKATAGHSVQGSLDTKAILKNFRQKYPQYDNVDDISLITLLIRKYTKPQVQRRTTVTSPDTKKVAPKVDKEITVYITKTGKKYHRAGCRYLSKSIIPISLKEAKRRGYGPCGVCKPPY